MADPEHLEILDEGIKEWNKWREYATEKIPDLSRANLSGADLRGIDLRETYLISANLSRANLSGAILTGSDLRNVNLNEANLSGAELFAAELVSANLRRANFRGADFRGAILIRADLTGASLIKVNLSGAKLTRAVLSEADLSEADLSETTLNKAECYKTNLSMATLDAARLINTKLDGATLTGARLWETQRAGWSIKGIICEYVYWDEKGNEKSLYSSGEFERLFADRARIRLFYKDGINPLEIATLPSLIKHLEDSHPGSGLRLICIREDSGGVVVELALEDSDAQSPEQLKQFKAELEIEAQQKSQYLRQVLEEALQLKGQIQAYERIVGQLLSSQKPTYYLEKGGIQMGDSYNISGQAGAVGHNAHAHDMTFNQVNYIEKSIDLPALAKQLAELREEMAKDSSPQSAIAQGETAKAEIAAHAGNASKVMEHLKSAGKWTLDFSKEIGKDLAVEAIKQSMGMP
jgi:hypothetical protein